ncbi:hypothetical protein RchiOBHm_Chr6g0246931 [Rosa chinensis]|uniref:Uncharacterized protein n=1 Tax=Rosa chinensis TaxID=74649 RepID=A0A2P6PJN3_ROSCH|nr:hypothetical protein RchiOBHm_Chr6g0246931 [Rosa chinensis]
MSFDIPPKYDCYEDSEVCDGGVEDQRKNELVPRNCDDEDNNKAAIKSILWKDIEHKFVDFVGVNAFIMHIPKELVNLVTQIKDGEKNFGIAKLMSKRKFMGSRLIIYSKYLFVWKGRIQLQVKGSTKDLK